MGLCFDGAITYWRQNLVATWYSFDPQMAALRGTLCLLGDCGSCLCSQPKCGPALRITLGQISLSTRLTYSSAGQLAAARMWNHLGLCRDESLERYSTSQSDFKRLSFMYRIRGLPPAGIVRKPPVGHASTSVHVSSSPGSSATRNS